MAVIVRHEPPLAWLVIDRPAAHNALDMDSWRRLTESIEALAGDDAVRVIVLRGAGDRAFVAGADIAEFRTRRGDLASATEYDRVAVAAWTALGEAPQPVIAMVNGVCFGGGVGLALACDVRLAAADARFGIPAARLGGAYPMPGVERLVRVVGGAHAADLLLSARTVDAGEALRMGLVQRVLARDDLERAARETGQAMARLAPLAVAAHKRMIRETLDGGVGRDPTAVAEAVRRCFESADYREGVSAFLEKRAPQFTGR